MLRKILATSVLVTLLTSTVLAQVETMSAPGKSLPVESEVSAEETLVLNSASSEPATLTLSEITVKPETNEAVLSFSTSEETHVVIEYGLTPEYDRSISTEPQVEHSETLGELLPCATYYYSVQSGGVSREGDFKTLCPVAKKVVKKPVVKKTPAVVSVAPVAEPVVEPVVAEPVAEIVPVLNAAPEEMNNDEGIMNNEGSIADIDDSEVIPETPIQPVLIAADDVETPSNATPALLLLFALLSGIVVVIFSVKKKKWYQK